MHVRTVSLLLTLLLLLPLLPPPAPAEPAGPREPGVFEFNIYLKAPGDPWHVNVTRAFYNLTQYRCELPNVVSFERIDEGNRWRYVCVFNSRNLTRYTGTAISSLTFVNVTLRNMTYYRYDFVFPKEHIRTFVIYRRDYGWMMEEVVGDLRFVFPAYNVTFGNITHVKKQIHVRYADHNGVVRDFGTLTIERVAANHLRIVVQRIIPGLISIDYITVTVGTHELLRIDITKYIYEPGWGTYVDNYAYLYYDQFNRVVINIYLQS